MDRGGTKRVSWATFWCCSSILGFATGIFRGYFTYFSGYFRFCIRGFLGFAITFRVSLTLYPSERVLLFGYFRFCILQIEIERATPTTNHGCRTDSALTIDPTASITIPQRHYWLVILYRRFKNDACAPATDLRSSLNCHSVSRVSVGPSVSPNTML